MRNSGTVRGTITVIEIYRCVRYVIVPSSLDEGFILSKQTRMHFQEFLKAKGFYTGNIDGIIGSRTKAAILNCFQCKTATAITDVELFQFAKLLGDTNTVRIRTVAEVESNGSGWFNDGRPKILYERHKFWKYNDDATAPKSTFFNYPDAGNYTIDADKNGINDSYDKLLKACEYDPMGAFMSVSMGAFQVMGFYFKEMGYATPWEMLYDCARSEKAQYQLLVNYIVMNKLQKAFLAISGKPDTCRMFASGYNGKNYAKYNYHGKLASAYLYYLNKVK